MPNIIKYVSKIMGVSQVDIQQHKKIPEFVDARTVVAGIAITKGYSASAIGVALRRDHTTIINLKKRLQKRPDLKKIVDSCQERAIQPVTNNIGKNPAYVHIYELYHGECAVCQFSAVTEICHIVPRCMGGADTPDNLILLCPNHHSMLDKGLLFIKDIHKP